MAVLATALITLAAVGSPAQADEGVTYGCKVISGAGTANEIEICLQQQFFSQTGRNRYDLYAEVLFSLTATNAKRCRVTAYSEMIPSSGARWNSPKRTQNCDYSVENEPYSDTYQMYSTYTVAVAAIPHVCVDLYYGTSTSSGWQRCWIGPRSDVL